jgi:Bifunctional DNA primase/polymerase, N-terminal
MTTSTELTAALHALPQEWALTPVNQKRAYFAGWQQTGLARGSIKQEITSGKADGFGIITGKLSGGLIAIDCDGHEPHATFRKILGGEIPKTVSFASGKEGRAQYLFSVPQEHRVNISTKREGDANNGGQLEWRWNGCHSVLPPSAHPETAGYYWVNSPDECSIAQLPEKALEHLLNLCKPKVSSAKPAPKKADNVPPIPLERCLSNAHREALENGVGEGLRSNTAISLARDLLGCAACLEALDEPYTGDAQSLYIEYCNRCSPPIDDRERDSTWQSANKYSPEPSISNPDAFQNCIDKWKREHGVERPVSNTTH